MYNFYSFPVISDSINKIATAFNLVCGIVVINFFFDFLGWILPPHWFYCPKQYPTQLRITPGINRIFIHDGKPASNKRNRDRVNNGLCSRKWSKLVAVCRIFSVFLLRVDGLHLPVLIKMKTQWTSTLLNCIIKNLKWIAVFEWRKKNLHHIKPRRMKIKYNDNVEHWQEGLPRQYISNFPSFDPNTVDYNLKITSRYVY